MMQHYNSLQPSQLESPHAQLVERMLRHLEDLLAAAAVERMLRHLEDMVAAAASKQIPNLVP